MKPLWLYFWLSLSLLLIACGRAPAPSSIGSGIGGAAVNPEPGGQAPKAESLASTPTLTPTLIPAPTPTATFTPTPTPPPPLSPKITLDPPVVAQGGVVAIRVQVSSSVTVEGRLDGRPFTLAPEGEGGMSWWAILGFGADSRLGQRLLAVKATDQRGQTSQLEGVIEVIETSFRLERVRLPPGQEALLAPEVMTSEKALLDSITAIVRPEKLWAGPFLFPAVGSFSSPFGARRAYNEGPPGSPHGGLDISAESGTVVMAANHGRVALARPLKVRGNAVVLDHGMGVYSGYYHMAEVMVQEGQKVAKGEPIGLVGETGMATGPHLHWDMIVTGVNVSPQEWTEREIPDWDEKTVGGAGTSFSALPNQGLPNRIQGRPKGRITVAVDPGHGGPLYPGAVYRDSDGGTTQVEKDLNLRVAFILEELLTKEGFQVIMTRKGDHTLTSFNEGPLAKRVKEEQQARVDVANGGQASILVSIHFNGFDDQNVRGTEVYYCKDRPFAQKSRALAEAVLSGLVEELEGMGYTPLNRGVKDDRAIGNRFGYEHAFLLGENPDFARPSLMPAVIGEALFLSNPYEARLLSQEKTLHAIAQGYLKGIMRYFAHEEGSF